MPKKPRSKRNEPHVIAAEAAKFGLKVPDSVPPSERYISPNQAAKILNLTGEAVKQWIYHRRLPAIKLSNGYWKVKVGDLEEFMKSRSDFTTRRILLYSRPGSPIKDLAAAIQKLGHEAVIAHNMADAMLKATDLAPSIFIINVSWHPDEAWKLVAKIRKTRNVRRLPILIVAEKDLDESESQRAVDLEVQGFLRHPVQASVLASEVEKTLGSVM